jgi:hypothetical protein
LNMIPSGAQKELMNAPQQLFIAKVIKMH